MKYFFILGNNPTLSAAELITFFNARSMRLAHNVLIIETEQNINAEQMIKKLGGTVKIGQIQTAIHRKDVGQVCQQIKKLLNPDSKSKFKFGISHYGRTQFSAKKPAMEIKAYLRERNVSCRWVTSREKTLSSVVVEQNKLISNGVEIVLVEAENKILIGRTLAVQPFKELSFRDYGRPARDDCSGMLPPKLARIMINLSRAKTNAALLDPFCGSGTILTEAMLMGYQHLIGSDISKKAIADTEKNINWTMKNQESRMMNHELFNRDVFELSKFVKLQSIDVIVTEPYLGPQRGRINIKKTVKELEYLYSQSLAEFKKALRPGGRIVIIWPIFTQQLAGNTKYITPELQGFKIINPIPGELLKNKAIKLTDRNTIVYGRPGQKIWREVVVLELAA